MIRVNLDNMTAGDTVTVSVQVYGGNRSLLISMLDPYGTSLGQWSIDANHPGYFTMPYNGTFYLEFLNPLFGGGQKTVFVSYQFCNP